MFRSLIVVVIAGSVAFADPQPFPTQPPPAAQTETAQSRPGYAWVPGFWRWMPATAQYKWTPGRLEGGHDGYRWEPGAWSLRGDHYVYNEGRWVGGGAVKPTVDAPYVGPSSPPPYPRQEKLERRAGSVWARGYYTWKDGAYAWAPGHWETVRDKQTWFDSHWERRGDQFRFVDGGWR